jgi:hypothetical protein
MVNGNVLEDLPSVSLLPNGTANIQLIDPVLGPYQIPYQSGIFDIVVGYTVTVPPTETENSTFTFLLTGNTGRPSNFRFDTPGVLGFFTNVSQTGNGLAECQGMVRFGVNEPLILQLSRVGGNPAVDVSVTDIYIKIKVVD